MIISDKSGSLWQFKRDEVPAHNADLNVNNSESFKYKAALIRKTKGDVDNTISAVKDTKIVVPLKYLSIKNIKNNIKYFLPRGEIKNYNLLIDRRNIYGQPINDLIKHYDGVRKVSIG